MSTTEIVQIILTCAAILSLVAVLAYFLIRLAAALSHVLENLTEIARGVRLIEDHCRIIGYGADLVNAALGDAAGNLTTAAVAAEGMVPARR